MATTEQIKAFIAEIAPCAQYAYKLLGKVKPSICIGMACVESAYGTSCIMRKHNAFMGFKVGSGKTATKYWDGTFFTSKTKEEYTIGTHTVITSAFRSYATTQQCIMNFYELLNTSLYSRVQSSADYSTQMQQIKACGYMTSSTEVNSVISIINRYGLTIYDGEEKNNYPEPIRVLRKGCRGDDVKWLQWVLVHKGYSLGSIDGIFGTKTASAVRQFQQDVFVDEIVGKLTLEKLQK